MAAEDKLVSEEYLAREFGISERVAGIFGNAESVDIRNKFRFDGVKEFNQLKIIRAMQKNRLSDTHFAGTTGYGYDDAGREILDRVYADVFKAEDALVRHQITAGTHALALCMYGNLRPGDELLSITGKPYDTLEEIIGIRGSGGGSLKEFNITYNQAELLPDGSIDYENINRSINEKTKMVFIQRSRGYAWRPALKIKDIKKAAGYIKNIRNDIIVLVDNCYGEFVEKEEPMEAGADIIAGSLIKNPGGGIAPAGGYIAGSGQLVKNAAYRLTTPGLGKKVGCTLGNNRLLFQGLFMAPHVVAESLKGAELCASVMQSLGFETSPEPGEMRGDIIQAIKFNDRDKLIAFCRGIQKGSPVDAFVTPQPWDMPGYDCQVIMAAGGFVQGSSIELSADAPVKPPYIAYIQGGMVYEHVKLGAMIAVQSMLEKEMI